MRVNIYAEEMTDRLEIIEKEIEGQTFTALRFYLELPVTIPDKFVAARNTANVSSEPDADYTTYRNVSGPFIHHPGDDDSSAVTFWGKQDLRILLRKALTRLDAHYGDSSETAALDAIAAALPILITGRESTVECATMQLDDGSPDMSTLDEGTRPFVVEYDRVIALCEDALQKAGLR